METKANFSVCNVKQKDVAFRDRVRVVGPRDEFWGGELSKEYRSRIMVNPTWGQLLRCLTSQMKKTRDFHHCFLEDASIVRREVDKDGVSYAVVRLETGS
jgi:hypothetical protein